MSSRAGALAIVILPLCLTLDARTNGVREATLARPQAPRTGEPIERRAATGEVRARKFVSKSSTELVDRKLVVDGKEIPMTSLDEILPSKTETTYVLVDHFKRVDSGRPAEFVRTYRTLANATAGGLSASSESEAVKFESELAGLDVIFALNTETGEYTASLPAESDADVALLEGLVADLDFAALLPGRSVENGDEWNLPLSLFDALIGPGGNLKLRPIDMDEEELAQWTESSGIEPQLTGTFTAKLVAVHSAEGARTAEIELAIEVTSTTVLTDTLEPSTQETTGGDMHITPIDARIVRKYEGGGTLSWDLGRGRLASLALHAELVETNASVMEVEYNARVTEQAHTMKSEGTLECRHTIE